MTRTPSPDTRGGRCALCGREVERITRHHLIPRSRHRRLRKRKRGGRAYRREELERTVPLCGPCHRHVHTVFSEKELESDYNTVEALAAHPQVRRFVDWISDKPHGTIPFSSRPR